MTTKRQYTRDTLLEVKIHVEESRRFSIRVPANADFLASSNPVQALAGGGVRSSHGRRRDGGPATAAFRDAPGHRDRRERRAVNPPADHQHSDDEQQISGDSPSEAVGVRANRGPENAWPRAPKPVDANGAVVSSPAPPSGNLSPATTTTAAAAGGDGGSSAPQAMWCYRFKGSSTESAAMKWSDVAGLVDSGVFDATSVEVRRITPAETDWTLFTDAQFALEKKSGAVVAEHTAPAPTSAAAPTVNSTGKQPTARPNGTSTSEAATPAAADGGKPSEAPKPKPNAWATGGKSFLAVVAPERVVSSSSQPASPSAPATVAMNAPTAERQAPQLSAIEQALTRVKSDTEIGGASSPSKAPSQKVPEHASVPASTSSTSSKTVPKPDTAAPAKVAPIPADIASPAVAQPPPRTSANSAPSAVVKPQTNPPAPEQPATNAVDAPKVEPKVAPPAAVGEPKPAPAVAPTAVVPAPTVASVAQDTPTVRPTAAAPSKKEARSAKTPSAPTSVDDKPAQQAAPAAPTVATAPPAPPAKPAWGKVATAVPAAVDFEKVLQEELTTPSIIAAPQSHWVAVAASPAVANTSSAINPNQESSTHDAKGAKHHQQQPVPATPGKAPAGPPLPRSKHDAAGQATSPTTSAPTPTPAPAAAPPLPKSKQLHHDPAIVSVSHTAPVSAPVVDHASTVPPPVVPERGHVRNNIPAPKSKLASSGGSTSDSSPTSPAQVPPPPYSEAPQQQQQQQPTPFAPAPAPRSKWLAKREQRKLLQGQNVVNSVPPAEPTAPLPVSIPVDAVPTTKPTFAQRRQERAERKLAEQQSLTTAAPPPQPVVVPSAPNQDRGLKRSSKTAVKRDSAVVAVEAPPVSPPFFVVVGDAAKTAPVDAEDTEASVTKRDRKRQQWQERMQGQKAARAAKRAQRDEEPFHAAEVAALPSPTPPSYGATNKVTAPTEDWGAVDDASAGATGGGKKKEKWTWKEKKQQIKERKAAAAAATAVSSPLPPPPPPGPQPSTSQSHEVVSKRKARQAVQQQPATDAPVEEDAATPSRRGEGKKQQLPKKSSAKTSNQPPASLAPPPPPQAPSTAVVQSSDVEPSAAKPKAKRANKIKPSASVPEPFETPSFVVAEASGKPKRQQQPLKAPQPQRKQELPPPPPPAPLAAPQHVDAAGGATRKRRVKDAVENATLPLSAPPAVAVALPRSQRKQRASHTDATAGNVNFLPPPPPPEYNAPPPAYVEGPSGAHETVGAGRGRKPFRPFARRARGGVY